VAAGVSSSKFSAQKQLITVWFDRSKQAFRRHTQKAIKIIYKVAVIFGSNSQKYFLKDNGQPNLLAIKNGVQFLTDSRKEKIFQKTTTH
jgi:hypothetical protein